MVTLGVGLQCFLLRSLWVPGEHYQRAGHGLVGRPVGVPRVTVSCTAVSTSYWCFGFLVLSPVPFMSCAHVLTHVPTHLGSNMCCV